MRIFCMSAMVMCSFSYNVVFLARGTRHCTARKFATPPCVSPFGHKENRRVYTLCPASKNKSWFPPGLSGLRPGVPRPCGDAFVISAFLLSYHMEPLRSEALWGRTIGTLLSLPPDCRTYSTEVTCFRSNLRLHRGLHSHADIVRLSWRLIIIPLPGQNVKPFSRIFSTFFVHFLRKWKEPRFCGKAVQLVTKYSFYGIFHKIIKQMFAFLEQMCYTIVDL